MALLRLFRFFGLFRRRIQRVPVPRARWFSLLACTLLLSQPALALNDEWYIGIAGGVSDFNPQPLDNSIELDEEAETETVGSFFIGRDFGISSLQLQVNDYGTAFLDNGEEIEYRSVEGGLLYRFFDTRDRQLVRRDLALSIYGRISLGLLDRDIGSDLQLETDSDIYFGAGFGAELTLIGPLSLRAEYNYVDRDLQTAQLALLLRFGGTSGTLPGGLSPTPTPQVPASSPQPQAELPDSSPPELRDAPQTVDSIEGVDTVIVPAPVDGVPAPVDVVPADSVASFAGADRDADGVSDDVDECLDSQPGYPTRQNGCPLLNGVLSGIKFDGRTSTISQSSFAQLDYLANLLLEYPQARVQLVAHTDGVGNRVDQANITRARLRVVGSYLVRKGISARRLVLRSLGGERPIADNQTSTGRAINNRLEVFEQR